MTGDSGIVFETPGGTFTIGAQQHHQRSPTTTRQARRTIASGQGRAVPARQVRAAAGTVLLLPCDRATSRWTRAPERL
ncbi:MAG TPA: hypothetical protein VK348_08555, partial [Planctomycetota bacterium]|nr:hypothetical protein [Planctomycetota bacterium]